MWWFHDTCRLPSPCWAWEVRFQLFALKSSISILQIMKPKTMMGRKNLLLVWTPQLCYTDCCQILHHFQSYRYVNFFILQSDKNDWPQNSQNSSSRPSVLRGGYSSIQWITQPVSLILIYWIVIYLDPVVQKLDNAIHQTNRYPEDKYYENRLHYPLDSNLSSR